MLFEHFPDNWRTSTLEELCTGEAAGIQTGPFGSQLHQEDYVEDGTPIITVEHLLENRISHKNTPRVSQFDRERLAKYTLRVGDIVFSRVGSVDRRSIVRSEESGWLFSGRCLRVRPNKSKIDPNYLSHYLGHPLVKGHLRSIAVGATMPSLNTKLLSGIEVLLPISVAEQKVIAHILGALDDKIELNRKTNETLEAMAKALFKSWFVDFDPVRAKAEGRPTGLPAEISDLFPDSFEDSELGEIPSGWNIGTIGDSVGEVFDGPHATPKEASDGNIFLGIKNMTGTSLDLTEKRWIGLDDWEQWTRRVVPRGGDIVFTYEAALGLFAVIPVGLKCCLGRRMALVRPMGDDATPYFWFHQFVAEPFQRLIEERSIHGATVNRTPLTEFPSYPVFIAPAKIRRVFESSASAFWSKIHLASSEAGFLATLRNALLPKLISGEIRIPDAEKMLEEVGD